MFKLVIDPIATGVSILLLFVEGVTDLPSANQDEAGLMPVYQLHCYFLICESESVSCSVVSDPLQPHGLEPARLLCSWDFTGKNTGVASHSLLLYVF